MLANPTHQMQGEIMKIEDLKTLTLFESHVILMMERIVKLLERIEEEANA
jgi:hypothetical protein